MQEELKKVTSSTAEPVERTVTLCIRSQRIYLSGIWSWEMQSPAVYCSDVMSFPDEFAGTKAIIHPDDLPKLMGALTLMEEKEVPRLDFRIITTYGQVKIITGQRISIEEDKTRLIEPVPGKEPWEEALEQLALRRENDFLQLRKELSEYTERLNGIGCWLVNKQSGLAWYSDNVFRIYRLAPQSLNAHANTFNHFIHEDDRIAVLDAFEKAYTEHAPVHIEYRIVLADDEIRTVQQITKWLYAPNGEVVFSGILRDVTDERAIADELLLAQSHTVLYQQLLKFSEQQSVTGYWFMNLATRKTTYSDNYYRIYGFKQAFLPNYNSFLNLVHADDRGKIRDLIERMYNEHVLPETEYRIIRPDGKTRYLKQSGKLFISPNKELMLIGLVQDISVQKGLEKKILELNEEISLNKVVQEMTDAAAEISSFMWMPDGYMQWSDGFYRMLGYRPDGVEALPRFLYKNIHPDDLKLFKQAETLLLNHQNHEDIIIRFISKTGMRKVKIAFRQINYGRDATIALVHDISKQEELEGQFRNNQLYTELMEQSVSDMILFTNTDHIILHWNKVAEQKTGIAKEDALYQNLFDVLPRLNGEDFLGRIHLAARGTEVRSARVSNNYLRQWHEYWLWPLKNEANEVTGVLHVVHDISKQLELQQQLSERLNFIENLVEASVDRIVVLDRFMNYLYWNKKAEDYYSVSKERVLGKNILEIFPSFRNDPSYNEFRTVLRGETVYLPPTENKETDEYFETYLIPIKNEYNDVTAVLWTVHDLSREYQLTKERTQTNNLLQATMDAATDMIQVFEAVRDEEGEIVDFKYVLSNHEAEKWMPADAIGKNLLQLQPGVVEEGIFDAFKQVTETGIAQQYEKHYVHEQFDGWYYQSVVKLNDGVATTTRNITQRKIAEQELQQSKNLLQDIIDAPRIGMAVYKAVRNEKGEIIDFVHEYINRGSIEMLDGEDFTGRLFTDHGENALLQMPQFIEVIKTGKGNSYIREAELLGRKFWFAITNTPLDGERLVHTWEDVTERKNAEQEIKEQAHFIESVTYTASAIISITTYPDGETVFNNHDPYTTLGFDADELVRMKREDRLKLVHPDDVQKLTDYYTRFTTLSDDDDVRIEYRLKNKLGEWIWLDTRGKIFKRDAEGKVLQILHIAQDITEKKKAEQEILRLKDEIAKTAEEMYRMLFNSIDEGFQLYELIYNDAGEAIDFRYIETNQAFERHTGLKNVAGKLGNEVVPNVEKYWFERLDKIVKTRRPLRIENYNQYTDRWYSVYTFPASNDGRPLLAALFNDITERKQREQQQEYFLRLNDAIRPLADPLEIQAVAADLLGEHLNVNQSHYGERVGDYIYISHAYAKGLPPMTGKFRYEDFGKRLAEGCRSGEVQVCYDAATDPALSEEERQVLASINMGAYVALPFVKDGEWVATLAVHSIEPRQWKQHEIELIRETAERTWAAVEKAKAEEALRASENNLRAAKEQLELSISAGKIGVWHWDVKHDKLQWSKEQEAIYGLQEGEFKGGIHEFSKFVLPEDIKKVATVDDLHKIEGSEYAEDFRIRRKDGAMRWIHSRSRKLLNKAGEIEYIIGVNIDTTDQKQAEEAIHENEANYKLILQQEVDQRTKELEKNLALLRYTEYLAQSGTWDYEIETGHFKWSMGMYKMFGLSQQTEVHPKIYLDAAVEEDRPIAKRIVNLLKKKHDPFEEIMRIKRNGEVRTIKIKGSVITDEKAKAQRVIGVDVDITNIRQAEEKLKESQHWLEQTAKASPDSITVYDLQNKQPVYLNNCLSEWIGVDADELIEMGIEGRLQLIHPEDRLNILHTNEKTAAAKEGEIVMMEYRIVTKEGKTLWLRNRSKPFQRDASGKVTHILSILQNVTEEVELREELQRRTEYAEAIIDASIDRIAVYDKELRIIAWNKRAEQLTGRKKQQVLGQKLFDVFPKVGEDEQLLKAHLDALEGSYVSLPARKGIYTNVYYERFFIPLKNERKETYAVVSVMHDVSELVKRNMELDELNQSLEEKNTELEKKNEEITSFAFVASHDMKEPLRKIHTFSDWLMEQETVNLSDKGKGLVEKINAAVHRMEILIDDILVLTKIHSDTRKAEEVNLNKVLKQVFDEMFETILLTQTGIQADELPIIKGNSNQIFYLFKNLISNAIKFQKPGNVPQIKITAEIISGEEVNLSDAVNEYAKISFADNGFGFDQRYAKKIFQVFQRLHGKHEFEGTGIGLAICKKIMENHEGMISVESEQGKGSVFSCYFPLH